MRRIKKHINFSNFWIKNGLILIILSIITNHLVAPIDFPLNKNYKFPWQSIIISIILGSLVILIASINFQHFKKNHFIEKINLKVILNFLFSTLGYISILYIGLYYIINGIVNGTKSYNAYYLLIGLSVTLLLSTLGIAILFSKDIYELYKFTFITGKLKVSRGGRITLVKFSDIAFIFSENKIVYIVKIDGNSIITDFTLNEIKDKISNESFFRANRQTIVHSRSIEQVKPIENGKLFVILKPTISNEKVSQINISRYKRQEFMEWFEKKI